MRLKGRVVTEMGITEFGGSCKVLHEIVQVFCLCIGGLSQNIFHMSRCFLSS